MTITRNRGLSTRIGAVALAAAALTGIGAGAAEANATNTSGFGSCCVAKGICIPRGTMTISTSSVGGSGRRVNAVRAGFTYVGTLCNTWIDHDFYDSNGNRTRHLQGTKQLGCRASGSQGWTWGSGSYTAPAYGKHCATLFEQRSSSIKRWKTVCNNIGG